LPGALELLLRRWDEIPADEQDGFANVEGRCELADGTPISSPLGVDHVDLDYYDATIRRGLKGDTCGIWRTDVLRAHPFPEDLGRFVSEELVFNRVAARYRTRWCDDVVAFKEYLPGGLSDRLTATEQAVASAAGRLLFLRELLGMRRPMPMSVWLRSHANESRYALHAGEGLLRQLHRTPRRWAWFVTLPAGLALFARDRARLKRGRGT
jgi:hypothetical protein